MLTYDEAAALLNISRRHMVRLVAERRIRYVKVGNRVRFHRADVEAFVSAHTVDPV